MHQPFCLFITLKEASGFISDFSTPLHKRKKLKWRICVFISKPNPDPDATLHPDV